jgi:putative endonuclease
MHGWVYILFHKRNGALYTGQTTNLKQRVLQHKQKLHDGFTARYGIDKLGWFYDFGSATESIVQEKRIKGGSRKQKLELIESMNPNWSDFYEEL